MEIVNLYRYVEENETAITPNARNEEDKPYCVRVIADEGKELINTSGVRFCCIDTQDPSEFTEVDAEPEEPEEEPEE